MRTAIEAATFIYNILNNRSVLSLPLSKNEPFLLQKASDYQDVESILMMELDVNLDDIYYGKHKTWIDGAHKGTFEDFVVAVLVNSGFIKPPSVSVKAIAMTNGISSNMIDSRELDVCISDDHIGEFVGDMLRAGKLEGLNIKKGITVVLTFTENEIKWE